MFSHTSRYYNLKTARFKTSDGREIVYVQRRFLPKGEQMPLLVEVPVMENDRLDLITHRTIGDAEQFWRVCDANNAMHPQELTAEPGERIRVPIPEAGS